MRGTFFRKIGGWLGRVWRRFKELIGVAGLLVSTLAISVDLLPKEVQGLVGSGLVSSGLLDAFTSIKGLLPAGLLTLGALFVTILVAPLVYETGVGLFRVPLLVLVATASAVIVAKLPAAIAPGDTWTSRGKSALMWSTWGLRVVLVVALVNLVGKLLLLHRFAGCHGAKVRRSADDLDRLLPFQRQDLERLQCAVLAGRLEDRARVVQLAGRWGEGKSFLIERLSLFLDHRDKANGGKKPCAVVVVDVWKQQSEPDLYLAIVEEILGHKRYWYRYGWLRYPLALFLGRFARKLRLGLSAGMGAEANLEVPLTLPRPIGQRALERLVAHVCRRGCRTVVVLDEIDRAAPLVAQAAVTLAVQALGMPGIVVVLSYVDQLIRYKAFNPLIDSFQDLGSTMQALIFAAGPDRGGPGKPGGPLSISEPEEGPLREWYAWKNAEEMQLANRTNGSTVNEAEDEPATDQDGHRLSEAVRLGYAGASPHDRRVLQRSFAQRYLGSRPIELQSLSDEDVARMVVQFETLSYLVRGLVGAGNEAAVAPAVKLALATWKSRQTPIPEAASIRALEGELFRRLSSINIQPVSAEFIAAVVVAAYDASWRQYARRRES